MTRIRSGWVVAIFAVLAAGGYGVCSLVIAVLGLYPRAPSLDDGYLVFSSVAMLLTATAPTAICVLALKSELGLPLSRAARDLGLGLAAGAGLVAAAVLIPSVAGASPLTISAASVGALALAGAQQLFTIGPTSIGEELLLRGVVLRELSRGTRPWIAVGLTGATFGVLHLFNPGASWIAAANVALVGFWFGALALRFSLWASIAAHLAWNWFEGFVFGQPVSGLQPGAALLSSAVTERGFLSGGDFGPEAAGLTTGLLVLATLATVLWPRPPAIPPA